MSAAHLYRCFDADGRLLYVGCTVNLRHRFDAHRRESWWTGMVARVRAEVYPESEARRRELYAIRSEGPRFNIAGRWALRFSWTESEYADYLLACEKALAKGNSTAARKHVAAIRAEMAERFPQYQSA